MDKFPLVDNTKERRIERKEFCKELSRISCCDVPDDKWIIDLLCVFYYPRFYWLKTRISEMSERSINRRFALSRTL
uniref:Uncharacterized protein n=1 Tax=Strigamia maritima TaxID=126957 RepID=T1IYD0_STRMM